ncbi:MAG: MGMT family protein [Flavobacteriales bacterium]|jgi:methylated-DNA-protein-cysteine methyltransferase-like protein|tara:strand:+ start:231 stop:569 length:339 start_codon:yes stop_codon:yes gene_type:complete
MESKEGFFSMVHEVARLIPEGRVTSYGAIAKYLGASRSARMVGWAMNSSFSIVSPVPAHRVVNAQGFLTGAAQFPESKMMERLLQKEGLEINDNRVQNFSKVFWDPSDELNL